jgi:hypothetical protein
MKKEVEATGEAEAVVDPNAAILVAFGDAIANEKSEDDVKMAMIGAGASFKNVTRLYNEYLVGAGLAMTKEAKAEVVTAAVDGLDLTEEEGFDAAVAATVEGGTNVTVASAAGLVRAWAKKQDPAVECFAKPKGSGAVRNPFVTDFHTALIANPSMDEQGLKDVIAKQDEKNQVNPQRWFNQHNSIRKMVNEIAKSLSA